MRLADLDALHLDDLLSLSRDLSGVARPVRTGPRTRPQLPMRHKRYVLEIAEVLTRHGFVVVPKEKP